MLANDELSSRWVPPICVQLASVYALLHLVALNPLEARRLQVLLLGGLCWLVGFALWQLLARLLPHRDSASAATIAACLGLSCYGGIYENLGISHKFLLPGSCLLWLVLVWQLRSGRWQPSNTVLLSMVGVLVAFPMLSLSVKLSTGWLALSRSGFTKPLKISAGNSRPDIVIVVLDEHARADMMREIFGLKDYNFDTQLRKRGFQVVDDSVSSYSWTRDSLTSALNLDYLPTSLKSHESKLMALRGNRTLRFFSDLNYQVLVASYCSLTDDLSFVDEYLDHNHLLSGQFYETFRKLSLCAAWDHFQQRNWPRFYTTERQAVLDTLAALHRVRLGGPTFVFAHLLCPHRPLVFDAEGRLPASRPSNDPDQYRRMYCQQTLFIDREILKVVDSLIAQNPQAILVILSDHGSMHSLLASPAAMGGEWEEVKGERLANFCAVRAPQFKAAAGTNPINLMRALLSTFFGQDLPPLEVQQ